MDIFKLILLVTENCNFFCKYCYQTKEKKEMNWGTAKKSLDFFFNQKSDSYSLYFLGGEPLLNFSLIKDIVHYLDEKYKQSKKKIHYNISTNGSLITDNVLQFFNRYHFIVELSFDGLAQDKSRKKGSFNQILKILKLLKEQPNITLHINSVFFPATVDLLSRSVEFILELQVPHFYLSLAMDNPWNQSSIKKLEKELSTAREMTLRHYQKTKNLPIDFYSLPEEKGIWHCSAGQDQITVSAEGEVWGCPLFYEYFKDKRETALHSSFFFGYIQNFIKNHKKKYPAILKNYLKLRMDNCFTKTKHCFLCPEIEKCEICPIVSSRHFTYKDPIPDYYCQIKRMTFEEMKHFSQEINLHESI